MTATLPPKPARPRAAEGAPDEPSGAGAGAAPPAPLLAGLMAGAALVHFVMVPIHAASSQLEGALFAVAGWTQAVLAVLLLVRNRRALQLVGAAANLAMITAWAYSRTRGLPFGAHAGVAESAGLPDLATVAMEAGYVLGVAGALANRGRIHVPAFASLALAGAVLGAATMVAIAPDTATHDHGADESATPATVTDPVRAQLATIEATRCDKHTNPRSFWQETATAGVDSVFGQGHLSGGAGPTAVIAATGSATGGTGVGHGHAHAGAASPTATQAPPTLPAPNRAREATSQKESKLLKLSQGVGEVNDAQLVVELSRISDEEYAAWLAGLHKLAAQHNSAAPDDNGGHGGHVGPNSWTAITDPQTCAVLDDQLALARDTALKYPTAADAEAAGWTKVTPYLPGIAAHYMNFSFVDATFEVDKPEMILYDGDGPDAHVTGLSYYVLKAGESEPQVGFAGANDHFHRHVGLCVKGTLVIGDTQLTEEQCAAAGGVKQTSGDGWMSHAWVVPGCESPWGLFSGANPLLDMQLGEQSGQNDGHCAASSVRDRYDLRPGENAPAPSSATPPGESAAAR